MLNRTLALNENHPPRRTFSGIPVFLTLDSHRPTHVLDELGRLLPTRDIRCIHDEDDRSGPFRRRVTPSSLGQEARRLAGRLDGARSRHPVHLVAHALDAAVALRAALDEQERFASITLIEPLSIHLLRDESLHDRKLFGECSGLFSELSVSVASGDRHHAAALHCDYLGGRGSWSLLSDRRRSVLADAMPEIVRLFWAAMQDGTRLNDLAALDTPILVLSGRRSPAPCRRIGELIATSVPTALYVRIDDAGHNLPFSHGRLVGRHVVQHIAVVESLRDEAA